MRYGQYRVAGWYCIQSDVSLTGTPFIAGSLKSQFIDYLRGHIVFWDKPLQFYAN